MSERLHPQSWRELRRLVLLHGADAIIRAVIQLRDEPVHANRPKPSEIDDGMGGIYRPGVILALDDK